MQEFFVNDKKAYDAGDYNKALEFFGKACDLKIELGCKNYARLKNKIYKQSILKSSVLITLLSNPYK